MFVAKIQGQKVVENEVRINSHVQVEVWEDGKVDLINGNVEDWNSKEFTVRLARGSEFIDDACNCLITIQF